MMNIREVVKKFPTRFESLPIPENMKGTLFLRAFGFTKIFLLFFVGPKVREINDRGCKIEIPLNRITRNHLGSMYFGALAIGADAAGGMLATYLIRASGHAVSLVFKDLHANFLKRPEANVVFTCRDGQAIKNMVEQAIETKERVNAPIHVTATVPKLLGDEPVAEFTLTLSLKAKV